MEDRIYGVSRWLVALTVVFIPLSIFILISGSFGANFGANQWTRYLLFASWMLMTLSLITGVSNLINPPLEESEKDESEPQAAVKREAIIAEGEEEAEKAEETARIAARAKKKPGINIGYALLLTQVTTFLLGMILYVVFISWMILPEIAMSAPG